MRALWLEVGFGGGEHALAQVAAHPEAGLIACEVFEQRHLLAAVARWCRRGRGDGAAAAAICGLWTEDARDAAAPAAGRVRSIALFLLFPDPWPKARHAKRRFVHPALLPLLARVLRPGAEWRIASDDPTYQAWVTEVMAGQSLFDAPAPVAARPPGWPPTRYEAKALGAGRQPLYWSLRRGLLGAPVQGAAEKGEARAPPCTRWGRRPQTPR